MARKLEVEIVGDASSLRRAVGQADSSSSKLGSTFKKLGKVGLLAGGAAGVGALVYTLKTGIGEFNASQKVAAQTAAVIKSTGKAAHVTAKDVSGLATSIMRYSGIDDEAIATGENMLLTFKNIRNEVGKGNDIFTQATKTMVDFSVATGKDAQSSAILLGKALNDPIKGITALTRVGVTFSDKQKAMIKGLVESGHAMEAQKLILKELNSEFGGSAKALGNTFGGQINIIREMFNNWAGDMVSKMIPSLERFGDWAQVNLPIARAKFMEFWAAVQPTIVAFRDLMVTTSTTVKDHWRTIGPVVQTAGNVIKRELQSVAAQVRIVNAILKGDWPSAWSAFKSFASTYVRATKAIIIAELTPVRLILHAVIDAVTALGSAFGKKIKAPPGIDAIITAFGRVKDAILAVVSAVNSLISALGRIKVPSIHLPSLPRFRLPGRAAGGAVGAGGAYLVGERGPEILQMGSRGGTVIPNGRGMGGGGMQTVNLVLDGRTLASILIDPLRGEIRQLQRAGGSF